MRNILLTIIAISILYTYFKDKNSLYSEISTKYTEAKNEVKSNEKFSIEEEKNNEKDDTKDKKRNYEQEPKGMVERVLTNALSDFMHTPTGIQFTKNMIMPSGMELRNNNIAITTSGYNPIKNKYEIEYITKNNANICICGQEIKLNYIVLNAEGKPVDSNIAKYKIGEYRIPEFNILVDNLAFGDVIKAKMLSNEAISSLIKTNKNEKIMMSIIEQITKHNLDASKIKIFDEYISSSRPLLCGDQIKIDYEIKNVQGVKLSSGKLEFKIGDWDYSPAISYSMYNMPTIGKRLVILPYEYLNVGDKKIVLNNLSDNEHIFLEFSNPTIIEKSN